MDTSDHNRVELTLWTRIEEIQGQEEVDTRACIKEKGMYGLLHWCKKPGVWERALECEGIEVSVRNVERILQIPAEECNAFFHLIVSYLISNR
jgi:hypothetical protein